MVSETVRIRSAARSTYRRLKRQRMARSRVTESRLVSSSTPCIAMTFLKRPRIGIALSGPNRTSTPWRSATPGTTSCSQCSLIGTRDSAMTSVT